MKLALVFVVFAFISIKSFCQSTVQRTVLGIEKENLTSKKVFIFKTHSFLRIKTDNGRRYFSKQYSFSDKFLVMNQKDTIYFDEISWIKGKVNDHIGDKIFGGITIGVASPIAAFGLLDFVFEGDPGAAISGVLFAGITYAGISLAGARKFHLRPDCTLKVFDHVKK